ncbi:unnamed protein product, partial [marine sediment metagenome]
MSVLYLNISETARYAGVTNTTVYHWIELGVTRSKKRLFLTAVTIGGQYRIEEPGLNRFLDSLGGYEYVEDKSTEDESAEDESAEGK